LAVWQTRAARDACRCKAATAFSVAIERISTVFFEVRLGFWLVFSYHDTIVGNFMC
jgi:hypothetical protein